MSDFDICPKYEISQIAFGVLSTQEILDMSVCCVSNNKLAGPNSVYDENMGCMENGKICSQCGLDNKNCCGHFGHISLNQEIIHPLYYKITVNFIKCFCINCCRLVFQEDQLKIGGYLKYTNEARFQKILEIAEKLDICPHCSHPKPKVCYEPRESNVYLQTKTKGENLKVQMLESEIIKIFENISINDVKLLGLNPLQVHPTNLIMTALPVIPPVARPYIMAEGTTCDDDLTIQYLEIIKINNHLADNSLPETKRHKYVQSLKFRIKCLFDNNQEKARHTNGRPMKSIKKRLAGKEGQIRNNLMGKRVNRSARTVIGPDPTLRLGEIAIPREMAGILTYPERVTNFNIEYLTDLINVKNKANFVQKKEGKRINLKYATFRKGTEVLFGDEIHRNVKGQIHIIKADKHGQQVNIQDGDKLWRKGKEVEDISYPGRKKFSLSIGDIVERHLRDGDIVLLNRQPTLHKGSMLAKTIKIRDGKTIRMNLATTKTFNADFDGDEMNIHAPSTPEVETELRELSATKHNLISTQSSKSNIVIVQDSLLAAYLMTKQGPHFNLTKATFFQIAMNGDKWTPNFILSKINLIRKVLKLKEKKVQAFNGRGLFSLLLPDTLNYEASTKADTSGKEPTLKIHRGVLYEGVVNKVVLGGSHNSLIQTLYKEYGEDTAVDFINNVQFIGNAWLLQNGFTVGSDDCIATKTSEISDVITRCFVEANGIKDTSRNPLIAEAKTNAALSKARDHGMRLAKEALTEDNNFVSTVTSGSKGDYFNIAQITGLLGQQNFTGARIPKTLNNNSRTLPHYPMSDLTTDQEYESRGFISNSFIHGLNPKEFWFHAVTGREGVTDTAMKTAQSGYIQRRMVKVGEDISVKYDGTVRNASGNIIQFSYGNDGLDASKTVIRNGKPSICNVNRLVDMMNLEHETK
jgi:DNA-directed RNA polymerase beta' subunit